ncbi:uncharacterized protein METZ01_LOCUS339378, partial [marine metagenome]
MNIVPRVPWLMIGLFLASLGSLNAQDQYASAVAVAGEDILVLKPVYGRGPAAVFVYHKDADGAWQEVDQLRLEDSESTGESF